MSDDKLGPEALAWAKAFGWIDPPPDPRPKTATEAASERPLHVRVAEALGWHDFHVLGDGEHVGQHPDKERNRKHSYAVEAIPRYDTDWSATGPLIEKYRIELEWERLITPARDFVWTASWGQQIGHLTPVIYSASDTTPLIAVCNLLLALHAAGKLPIAS
jgi:hypothetical protein